MMRVIGAALMSMLVLAAVAALAPAEVKITVVPLEGEAVVVSGWIETERQGRIDLTGEAAPFENRYAADQLTASIVAEGDGALRVEARIWKGFVPLSRLELRGRELSLTADRLWIAGRAG